MPASVRVIGRIDLAEKIRAALRSAGIDAEIVTAGPITVYRRTPPAEGVDVVAATSIFDPPLWRLAKRKHPLRPMVAVAERRRERALRGALARRNGPDAYVTWPATPVELADALRQAESSASRRRSWGRADLAAALAWCGVYVSAGGDLAMNVVGAAAALGPLVHFTGILVAGIGVLAGVPSAWNARWQAIAGVVIAAHGAVGVALFTASHWFR